MNSTRQVYATQVFSTVRVARNQSGGGDSGSTLQVIHTHGFRQRLKALFIFRGHSSTYSFPSRRRAVAPILIIAMTLVYIAQASAVARDQGILSSLPSGALKNDAWRLQCQGSDNAPHTMSVFRIGFQGNMQTRHMTYRLIGGSWYPDAIVNGCLHYPSYSDGLSALGSYNTGWAPVVNYTTGGFWNDASITSFSMWPFAQRTNVTNNANGSTFAGVSLGPAAKGEGVYQDIHTAFGAIYCWSLSTGDTKAVRFTSRIISTPSASGRQHGFNHGVVSQGETPIDTITVNNAGNGDPSGVLIRERVPTNATLVSVDKRSTYGSAALLAGWALRRRGSSNLLSPPLPEWTREIEAWTRRGDKA